MKKVVKTLLFLFVSVSLLQCSEGMTDPDNKENIPRDLTAAEKSLAESANKFSLKLFREINNETNDENLFISPLSVSMALGMAYNGADGETREAIQNTLELSGLTLEEVNDSYKSLIEFLMQLDPDVAFQIANSIWHRIGFTVKKEFIDLNRDYFNAKVAGLDFNDPSAADTINAWVYEKTNGKIKGIIEPPIDPLTMLFLINAIYFKGSWTYEFDEALTTDDIFRLPDGTTDQCKMMHQKSDFPYFAGDDFQAVDLPYGNGMFNMAIFLPSPGSDIDAFIAQLNEENWELWFNSFAERTVNLSMPKFKLECKYNLNDALKALGMGIAFDAIRADFGNINNAPDLHISNVKHKTFVEVNEEGTEAAAVTSIEIGITSVQPNEVYMRVDRPYIFVIHENQSNAILFMGKMLQPAL